jgi:hypothetical protein
MRINAAPLPGTFLLNGISTNVHSCAVMVEAEAIVLSNGLADEQGKHC